MALAAAGLGVATPAFSQSRGDPAAAEVLFGEGKALASRGQYAQACPKFEESQRLDPGIGTLFNLADCYEKLGLVASAWSRFLEVATHAKLAGQSEREKVARSRAGNLEPRLPKVVIQVQANDDGLEVHKDDTSVGRVLWGTAVPTDPGRHTILARAPGKKTWKSTVVVAAGGATLSVVVPALEPGTSLDTGSSEGGGAPQSPSSVESGGNTPPSGPPRWAAYGSLALGAVGLGLGAAFGLSSRSRREQVEDMCRGDQCPSARRVEITNLQEQASRDGMIAATATIVGGVGVAAGVALLVFGRRDPTKASASSAQLMPWIGGTSVGVAGSF